MNVRAFRLPEPLPAGEEVLWQGRPSWRTLAIHAFHARKVAIYFGILAVWRLGSSLLDGAPPTSAAIYALWLILPAAAAVGVLTALAWLTGRSTRYTITSRRIVIQFGIALPMTLNIPFRIIGSAAVKSYADGTGEIPISITGGDRIAYLLLWPHARPWRAARAEPMLRAVPDAKRVAEVLARALIAASETTRLPTRADMANSPRIDMPSPAQRAAAAA
jgi:Bacterial PH domain